jgi:hypothetical protein
MWPNAERGKCGTYFFLRPWLGRENAHFMSDSDEEDIDLIKSNATDVSFHAFSVISFLIMLTVTLFFVHISWDAIGVFLVL